MRCQEKGTGKNSVYYFFSPSEMFCEYYTYMLLCGHFYCYHDYKIVREGNTSPLFIYIISGKLHIRYQNRLSIAGTGEIVLLDCNQPHSYYCSSHCEFMFFHYDGPNTVKLTNHLISQNQSPVFRIASHLDMKEMLYQLLQLLNDGEHPTDIELSCTAYHMLCQIQSFNYVTPNAPSAISDTVAEIIEYMKINIQEPMSLDILASHVNISPSYLSHLFRAETGCSPIEYLARLKINLAKTILKSTTRTISDIGISLGYSSSASFINAFTSRVGVSPKKYRNSSIL